MTAFTRARKVSLSWKWSG